MRFVTVGLLVAITVGCGKFNLGGGGPTPAEFKEKTLAEARKSFATKLPASARGGEAGPPAAPPRGVFRLARYDSEVGKLAAYVTPDPRDGVTHPAVVWVTGGDCNSIGPVWGRQDPKNDQTAQQYRDAGVVLMIPSLRGGNDNPGRREFYYGELDDVVACAAYLRTLPYVDPDRVYLGGHSTGGTVALLAAEYTDTFRAVFSFGPVDTPTNYPDEYAGFNTSDAKEVEIRSPGKWLGSIKSTTVVVEGARSPNSRCLATMARGNTNSKVTFVTVRGGDHFDILAPLNQLLAQKILADTGPACAVTLTEDEAAAALRR
ncbi:alpha/beta fold hydrolase [bacterium]|nr:alpha/beta fold hydrolase [bacterium]